ncbi:MAG: CorA family divalent cation transporter [Patescibacteria group bacterium]
MARQEIESKGLTWVHITQPTKEDFSFVKNLHPFDDIVLDYLASPTLHPSLEEFGDHIFFILHFPIIFRSHVPNRAVEVDFLLTKNTLVTFTYEHYQRLETLFQNCREDDRLRAKYFRSHSGYILYMVLERLYHLMIRDRDHMEISINKLERAIFSRAEERLVIRISQLIRDILDFRRVFSTQGNVLVHLPKALHRLLGKTATPQFTNIIVTHDRIQTLVNNHKETIDALQTTYRSLVDNRISRILKALTIFSAIILPLSLVASIWGMNHEYMPLRDGPYDFWIVLGLMLLTALVLILGFRRVRWL